MIAGITVRSIVFSVNCYIATILTMFIAFSLDLNSPGWAMTTVYLTSQPLSGVLRAKAVYRVIGTFVGAAAMIVIVPNLVDTPELTTAAIIVWVGLCVFVSLLDRTPRSYMFVLSGYTAALIGFPSVLAPETVFDTAVSRVEEITLGVVCAAMVHSLIFPKSAFSAFEEKLRTAMAGARRWLASGLSPEAAPQDEMGRRKIGADIGELYSLGTSLRYDTAPRRPDIGIVRAFDRRMVTLLPLLSSIEDRLSVLRRHGPLDAKLAQVLTSVREWFGSEAPVDPQRATELKAACMAATPAVGQGSSWPDLVTVNLTVRLAELIDAWQACLGFASYLADPKGIPSADLRTAAAEVGPKSMHTDPGVALLSAVAAAIAMSLCAFFWIVTAWPEGALATAFAAVACTLFASLDDPTPTIRSIVILLVLCIPLVVIYQFFLLPAISGFELLCVVLAFTLIPAGILLATPPYSLIGLALGFGFCVELSLQANYTADLASILNTNSAFVAGGILALTVTRLMRVIGKEASAQRLMRATYRDLGDLSDGRRSLTRDEWASRMLDRVALLFYRQPHAEQPPQHEFTDALADLRLGINIVETKAIESGLSNSAQLALSTMFVDLARYFRALARGQSPHLSDQFLQKIDAAIDEVTACTGATHACVAAIVGLRRSLYPSGAPYEPQPVERASDMSPASDEPDSMRMP